MPLKKSKEKRTSDCDKIEEYSQKYNTLFIIQNAAVPNKSLQELRAAINGKVIFVKK
ncbi:hypothetical protein ENBRE01_3485, partial [Enteropsectra breve]